MPTYDYVCEKCRQSFEEFQSISAKPLTKCPACQNRSLKRLIGTGAGIIFKGNGFYQTDYRSESYKQGRKKEKSSSDSKTKETKSQSKDTKSEKPPAAKDKSKSA